MRVPFLKMRERLYFRYYGARADKFSGLYRDAGLACAPGVSLRLLPTDVSHRWIALTGFYELSLTRMIARLAKKGGILVDAGANFGYYSCLWAGANPDNLAIAFEPSPVCIPHLEFNVKKNRFQERILVKEIALGKDNRASNFSLGPDEQTGWGGLIRDNSEKGVEVQVRRLDDIYDTIDKSGFIDVLKIDTEGADTWVIFGAERLLKEKKIRHIFFEENIDRMAHLNIGRSEAGKFLGSLGYRIKYLNDKTIQASL